MSYSTATTLLKSRSNCLPIVAHGNTIPISFWLWSWGWRCFSLRRRTMTEFEMMPFGVQTGSRPLLLGTTVSFPVFNVLCWITYLRRSIFTHTLCFRHDLNGHLKTRKIESRNCPLNRVKSVQKGVPSQIVTMINSHLNVPTEERHLVIMMIASSYYQHKQRSCKYLSFIH